jgi:hypothetical protein
VTRITKLTVTYEDGTTQTWRGDGGVNVGSQNRKGQEPKNLVLAQMSVPKEYEGKA